MIGFWKSVSLARIIEFEKCTFNGAEKMKTEKKKEYIIIDENLGTV